MVGGIDGYIDFIIFPRFCLTPKLDSISVVVFEWARILLYRYIVEVLKVEIL